MKIITNSFIIIYLIWMVGCISSCLSPGSFPDAERYEINCSEPDLIFAIEKFKMEHPEYNVPSQVQVKDGRREHWYYVYFYYEKENEIVLTWVRRNWEGKTIFAFVGINESLTLGKWKDINKDYSRKENKLQKRKFERLILNEIKKQIQSELKLQNSFQIRRQTPVCINTKDCFYFSADSSLNQLFMYYSNKELQKKQLIDTVDFSPYQSQIHCFGSKDKREYVVFWETEYEHYPLIYAYYITEGKIVKMGELRISSPCQSCESFAYSIKDIRVLHKGKNIEIAFLNDVNYMPKNSTDWHLYKGGVLKCIFNTATNELKYSKPEL